MERKMLPENSNPKPEEARLLSRQERIAQLKLRESRLREQAAAADKLYENLGEESGCDFRVGRFVDADGTVWQIYNNYKNKGNPYGWLVLCCDPNAENDSNTPEARVQEITENGCTEEQYMPFVMPEGVKAIDTLHFARRRSINVFWKDGGELVVADSLGRELLPLDEITAKEDDTDKSSEETTAGNNGDNTNRRFKEIVESSLADVEEGLGAAAVSDVVHVAA
ncbi:hypothetical protein EUA61_02280 [TM7 phylum sp. oral taxon 346]|nr:hypothetical protein EUA61_02280 [TM7 phylum sp. oral taxon 346]